MEYYYTPKDNIELDKMQLRLEGSEFRHLTKVLRKKTGDLLTITDGELNVYFCRISDVGRNNLSCKILERNYNLYEPEINIRLCISLLKNSSRLEFAIEKAVELGVKIIQPVVTEHTVNKSVFSKNKSERLNKIILSASCQSQRCFIPKLNSLLSLPELIETTKQYVNKIVMYEFSDSNGEIPIEDFADEILLLIGPEGGFSTKEISELKENNWIVKSLGKRKLRAETASIISIYSILNKLKL